MSYRLTVHRFFHTFQTFFLVSVTLLLYTSKFYCSQQRLNSIFQPLFASCCCCGLFLERSNLWNIHLFAREGQVRLYSWKLKYIILRAIVNEKTYIFLFVSTQMLQRLSSMIFEQKGSIDFHSISFCNFLKTRFLTSKKSWQFIQAVIWPRSLPIFVMEEKVCCHYGNM